MPTIKTSELTGAALEWAVAKCEGEVIVISCTGRPRNTNAEPFNYSTDWSQGGPIIEREKIEIIPLCPGTWRAVAMGGDWYNGRTPLEAVMRCYVASKMGETIEVPEELTQ